MLDVGQRVQTSGYKMSKSWGSDVEQGNYSGWYCIVHLGFAGRARLRCHHMDTGDDSVR